MLCHTYPGVGSPWTCSTKAYTRQERSRKVPSCPPDHLTTTTSNQCHLTRECARGRARSHRHPGCRLHSYPGCRLHSYPGCRLHSYPRYQGLRLVEMRTQATSQSHTRWQCITPPHTRSRVHILNPALSTTGTSRTNQPHSTASAGP